MARNKGDTATVAKGPFAGRFVVIHRVFPAAPPTNQARYHAITSWDGQLYNFMEDELENEKIVFEIGDAVGSKGNSYGTVYEVTAKHPDGQITIRHNESGEEWTLGTHGLYIVSKKQQGCQHDFKLEKGFRHDEYCCTKCPAKKPFSIYRDGVS